MPRVDELSEPGELRRCIRDLVALSSLPGLWTRSSPKDIVDSLALALLSMLRADFIYIALPFDREESMIEAAYVEGAEAAPATVRAIASAIAPFCPRGDGQPEPLANPLGTGIVRIACTSIGGKAVLVGGSAHEDFPTEAQRLLLNIAANEAAIALQRWGAEAEERRFTALVDRSSDFVAFSDLNGRPQYVNTSGLTLIGLTVAELFGLSVFDFVIPSERRRVTVECWPTALHDGRWIGELNFRNFRTDEVIPFLVDMFRIEHPRSGRPMNIATISRDLRRQKQAEFELRRLNDSLECRIENCTTALVAEVAQRKRADARSQKLQFTLSHAGRLSTAGQMAGAIAHEMSQPLTAVANSANAARRLLTQAGHERIDTIQEILDEIAGQSLRAGQILRRLRDFVIRGEGEKQVEDLEALVRDASVFARIGVETLDVELRFDFDPTASFVFANRIQIQQVLVNLLRNALEAMVGMKRPQLLVSTLRLDDAIEIAVVDNGPGLPEEIVQHLFEPFVSTKSDGMGFGLAICRSIVEAHNGVLHLEPNPAGGSVFRFTLPFATEARQDHARQEHDLRCSGESTIYVVDDDAAVLRSLERLLGAAGYETMSFEQPVALLEAVSQLSEGCILLDVRMPGLNGLEVQAALAKLDCRLPVIVMTGQGDVPTAVRAMKAGAVDFIEKPFSDEELLAAIEAALTGIGRLDSDREASEAAERLAVLSPRERAVLDALVAGGQNKIIAFDLGISVRTVEAHRARMMHRLGVGRLAEAVRLVILAGSASSGESRRRTVTE